jgi:hypothetical protein
MVAVEDRATTRTFIIQQAKSCYMCLARDAAYSTRSLAQVLTVPRRLHAVLYACSNSCMVLQLLLPQKLSLLLLLLVHSTSRQQFYF